MPLADPTAPRPSGRPLLLGAALLLAGSVALSLALLHLARRPANRINGHSDTVEFDGDRAASLAPRAPRRGNLRDSARRGRAAAPPPARAPFGQLVPAPATTDTDDDPRSVEEEAAARHVAPAATRQPPGVIGTLRPRD